MPPLVASRVPVLVTLLPRGLIARAVLWLALTRPALFRFNWASPRWPEPWIVLPALLVRVDGRRPVVLKMKFSTSFDIASVPPPLSVTTLPPMTRLVTLLPVDPRVIVAGVADRGGVGNRQVGRRLIWSASFRRRSSSH